jgi:hypothetical protein
MFLMAAFHEKDVPLKIVSTLDKADYTLDSTIFQTPETIIVKSTAKSGRTSEAAMKLTDNKTGEVVWAYAVTKGIMSRGSQSVAEACAKHLNEIVYHVPKPGKHQRDSSVPAPPASADTPKPPLQ